MDLTTSEAGERDIDPIMRQVHDSLLCSELGQYIITSTLSRFGVYFEFKALLLRTSIGITVNRTEERVKILLDVASPDVCFEVPDRLSDGMMYYWKLPSQWLARKMYDSVKKALRPTASGSDDERHSLTFIFDNPSAERWELLDETVYNIAYWTQGIFWGYSKGGRREELLRSGELALSSVRI